MVFLFKASKSIQSMIVKRDFKHFKMFKIPFDFLIAALSFNRILVRIIISKS